MKMVSMFSFSPIYLKIEYLWRWCFYYWKWKIKLRPHIVSRNICSTYELNRSKILSDFSAFVFFSANYFLVFVCIFLQPFFADNWKKIPAWSMMPDGIILGRGLKFEKSQNVSYCVINMWSFYTCDSVKSNFCLASLQLLIYIWLTWV